VGVEKGARTHVNVDMQRLFLQLLLSGAPAFILLHNHPSGNLRASDADGELTGEVSRLARQLGLNCLSHLIVTASAAATVE
jgi:DNA repair protein RadC